MKLFLAALAVLFATANGQLVWPGVTSLGIGGLLDPLALTRSAVIQTPWLDTKTEIIKTSWPETKSAIVTTPWLDAKSTIVKAPWLDTKSTIVGTPWVDAKSTIIGTPWVDAKSTIVGTPWVDAKSAVIKTWPETKSTIVAPWLDAKSTIVSPWLDTKAAVIGTPWPLTRTVVQTPLAVRSQYHAQDELGQFAFGHRSETQAREEVKSIDGSVRGAYSYLDPVGKLIKVEYLADDKGFKVLAANNLPVAPEHKVELVKDTPEVVAAREDFARKFEEAKEASLKVRRRRDVLLRTIGSPLLAKTTIKTSEFKPVDDVKTPAATRLAKWEDTEREIVTPLLTSHIISPYGYFF